MKQININVSSKYEVLIEQGLLANAGKHIKRALRNHVPAKLVVVSDDNVSSLYGSPQGKFIKNLKAEGFEVHTFVFKNGEASKSLDVLSELLDFLSSEEVSLTRSDALVALGGGVTGDLTGFAASIYLRGIPYVQVPTTLLAALDSAVGGKTGIDLPAGKNLAGSFWQPKLVLFDSDTLATLDRENMMNGFAEAIKCGLIAEKDLISYLQNHIDFLKANRRFNGDSFREILEIIVAESVFIKKTVIEADELDMDTRQLLNFGHTAAHAIEKLSNYTISHGQAVAKGMSLTVKAAIAENYAHVDFSSEVDELLIALGFDLSVDYTAHELAQAALSDKKRRGDRITLAVPVILGRCVLKTIDISNLEEFFRKGGLR